MVKISIASTLTIVMVIMPIAFGQNGNLLSQQATPSIYACMNGYFWSGQTCLPCLNIGQSGYCTCTSYNGCDAVVCLGNMVNIGTTASPQCEVACSSGCSECGLIETAEVCNSCNTGYQLISGICIQLNNCSKYSATTAICEACNDGFYFNWQGDGYSSLCSPCGVQFCAKCGSQNTCSQCLNGYAWNPSAATPGCQSCAVPNCMTCTTNITSCTACQANSFLLAAASGTTAPTCQVCSQTLTSLCLTCTDANTCTSCQAASVLVSSKCVACPSDCAVCSSGSVCTTCNAGFIWNGTLCIACPTNCLTGKCTLANNVAVCSQCNDKYYLQTNVLCTACPTSNNWLRCAGPLDPTPTTYTTLQPTQCENNYWASPVDSVNQCVLLATENSCINILGNVAANCAACLPGYTLVGSNCLSCSTMFPGCTTCSVTITGTPTLQCATCSSTTFLSSGKCLPCGTGCVTCTNSSTCSACSPQFYLNLGTCSPCSVSNCSSCDSTGKCNTCLDRAFLTSTTTNSVTTYQCNLCPSDCLTCSAPGNVCTTCPQGSMMQNNGCIQTADTQCLKYDPTTGNCSICDYGFYLENGNCVNCIAPTSGFVCRSNSTTTGSTTPSVTTNPNSAPYISIVFALVAMLLCQY